MAVTFVNTTEIASNGTLRALAAGDTLIVGPATVLATLGEDATAVALDRDTTLRVLGDVLGADGFGVASTGGANTVAVAAGGTVHGAARGILLRGEGNGIDVAGTVTGGDYGIHVAALDLGGASRTALTLAATGRIAAERAGGVAVQLSGAGSRLVAAGEITARGDAVRLDNPAVFDPTDAGLTVTNHGRITSAERDGVVLQGAGRASLANTGTIAGAGHAVTTAADRADLSNAGTLHADTGAAVLLAGHAGAFTARILNTGLIEAASAPAIEATAGATRIEIVNQGTLLGGVRLQDGANLYDGREGTVVGWVAGGTGADTLLGGRGGDALAGGAGEDWLAGGAGDDTLRGGLGADRLDGGDGTDTLDYARSPDAVRVSLARGEAVGAGRDGFGDPGEDQASGDTFTNIERVQGSDFGDTLIGGLAFDALLGGAGGDLLDGQAGNDTLYGEEGQDTLRGSAGDDLLLGGAGDDSLRGGAGRDTLLGGEGADTLRGGGGRDLFRFTQADTGDFILDFTAGNRIDLAALAPSAGGWVFVGTASFSGQGREVRAVQAAGLTFLQADAGGDGVPELSITLIGAPLLGVADLVL